MVLLYPRGLIQLRERLRVELEQRAGRPVEVSILADVLEIREEAWRGAVEGYLNAQKFYLLVEPDHYQTALKIYDWVKREFGQNSFGLVDIGKLREDHRAEPAANSLAQKVETQNNLARSYINYLLGRVVCCDRMEELRTYRTAITAEGMLYQGYVARPLRRAWMEDAFIGRQAVALRIQRLEEELKQLKSDIQHWSPILLVLQQRDDPLFNQFFVQNTVEEKLRDYLRGLELKTEIEQIEEQISQLDLLWLDEQRRIITHLDQEIKSLNGKKDEKSVSLGRLREQLHQLEYERLPDQYQKLSQLEDSIRKNFSPDYQKRVGLPRYQQELERLKRPSVVRKNFSDQLERTKNERDRTERILFQARQEYGERFKPCSFRVDAPDNEEYEAEQRTLEESELPKFIKND